MTGQLVAALVVVVAVVGGLVPLLLRDLRRAERRAVFPGVRLTPWQRDLLAFPAEERIAMTILRPTEFVKIVDTVA